MKLIATLAVILVACVVVGVAIWVENGMRSDSSNSTMNNLHVEGDMPSLEGATAWLNSPPLTAKELKGKVVLIDFWTYTCINWLRTQPYVRAWAEKYKDKGLVVIGVHSPEFEFEKDLENVRRAAVNLKVDYPIAVDSNYSVWRAFNNRYWPAFYFVDAKGRIRHHQFGEGDYERSEKVIQQLLAETSVGEIGPELAGIKAEGIETQADWDNLKSSETYTGYEQTSGFASPGGIVPDERATYWLPKQLRLNQWAVDGVWQAKESGIRLLQPNGRIVFRFHARDLNLVMGPVDPVGSIRFQVLIDGKPPGKSRGLDVDEQGYGNIAGQRLYQLVRQTTSIIDRDFEIEFLSPGVDVYVFTFG